MTLLEQIRQKAASNKKTIVLPEGTEERTVKAVETIVKEAVECIKCGRCADVCPMELRPLYFTKYALSEDWEGMKTQNTMDCIECGCCEYICSSKIPIVERIKIGKTAIREGK